MFNIQGSELIFLLLVALIVLGPEKLPDAIRKFGRAYGEFKKMANGFQGELTKALDEPMRELRDTADAMRAAANFDLSDGDAAATPATPANPATPAPVRREQGLNFGSANPRRTESPADAAAGATGAAAPSTDSATPPVRPQGLNFGSANPRRTKEARDPLAASTVGADPTPEVDLPPVAALDDGTVDDGTVDDGTVDEDTVE